MEQNRFLRPRETCAFLHVSRRTLTNLARRPDFPRPVRVPGTQLVWYDREKLEAFLAGETAEASAES